MLKNRLVLTTISLILLTSLTGCFDFFGFPNVGVSPDNNWVAYLALAADSESNEELFQLRAVNLADGSVVSFSESDQQGAFAWHPTENRIAYYNITPDNTTTIRISSIDDPTTGEDIIGAFAFPTDFFVTQMAFSPDGTQLAMTVILSDQPLEFNSDETDEGDGDDSVSSATELGLNAALYIANLSDGSVLPITTVGENFPSIVSWSPNGDYLAFLAWTDGNGDGFIDVSGSSADSGGDITTISVYDIASDSITLLSDQSTLDLSPTWIGDSTLAYLALNLAAVEPDEAIVIRAYDAATSSSVNLFTAADLGVGAIGINASPDGTQLAFVGLPLDEITGGTDSEDAAPPPAPIYVLNIASGELRLVYEYAFDAEQFEGNDSTSFSLDVPVWTQDGSQLIIASANPLTSLLFSFAAGFAAETESEEIPVLPVIVVNVASGEASTLITEPVGSSGLLQSLVTLAQAFADFGMDGGDDSFQP